MSNYQYGISSAKSLNTPRPVIKSKKVKHMKLTIKQRFKNWLMTDDNESDYKELAVTDSPSLESDGMRLQIYKANGGFVVETRSYDRRKDQNNNSMHVITEDQDLGDALGKIVMMEALRG